jgi:hypothetical protein
MWEDEMMLQVTKLRSRIAVALGGFLIFVGIIVVSVFLISFFGMVDLSILESESLPLLLLLAVGLVDLVAGIILWRRWFDMKIRGIMTAITGIAQGAIGVLSAVLAVLLFFNILEVQTLFNVPSELLPLYLLIFCLFSVFSILSGLFLIREWRGIT